MKFDGSEYRIPLISTDVILTGPLGRQTPLDALTVARKIIADMRHQYFKYLNDRVLLISKRCSQAEDHEKFMLELDKFLTDEEPTLKIH